MLLILCCRANCTRTIYECVLLQLQKCMYRSTAVARACTASCCFVSSPQVFAIPAERSTVVHLLRLAHQYSTPWCANCTIHVHAAELYAVWLFMADCPHLLPIGVSAFRITRSQCKREHWAARSRNCSLKRLTAHVTDACYVAAALDHPRKIINYYIEFSMGGNMPI
jgi:hypothetical protein